MTHNLRTQSSPPNSSIELLEVLEARLAPAGVGRFVRLSGNDFAHAEECEGFWTEARMRPDDEMIRGQLLVAVLRVAVRLHLVWERRGYDLPAHILVDSAIARLRQESHRGARWLDQASIVDEAEVLLRACDRVDRFQRDFAVWSVDTPVRVESIAVQFGDGLKLVGNPDLAYGTPTTEDGLPHGWATTLTIAAPDEPEERTEARVRFDQLVETMRFGGPPQASLIWQPETGAIVTVVADQEHLLDTATGAALLAVSLRKILSGGEPLLSRSRACGVCPRAEGCPELARYD